MNKLPPSCTGTFAAAGQLRNIMRLKTHGHSPSCVALHYGTGASFFSVFLTVSSEMRSTISTRRPASSVHSPRAGTRPASPPSPPFWPAVHLLLAGGVQPPQRLRKRSTVAVPMPSAMSASTSAPSASGPVPGARQPRCHRLQIPALLRRKGHPVEFPALRVGHMRRSCHCPKDLRACPLSGPAHGAACLFGILPVSALSGFQRTPTRKYYPQKPSIQCRCTTSVGSPCVPT